MRATTPTAGAGRSSSAGGAAPAASEPGRHQPARRHGIPNPAQPAKPAASGRGARAPGWLYTPARFVTAPALESLLALAPDATVVVDSEGRVALANARAAALFGYASADLVRQPARRLLELPASEELPDAPLEARAVRADGMEFPVEISLARYEAAAGPSVVVAIRERVRMEAALREARERAARERVQAAEAERARWARELHDETLQGLAGLHVLLSSASRASAGAGMRERIGEAQEEIENEMEKLRGLISELRPAALDELGLEASVRDLADRTRAVYGIEVETILELTTDGAPRRLESEVETAAYRIVQESLSNAARHAYASRVVVEVAQRDGSLRVRVRDDGRGFEDAETTGFGLRGMRERVDLLDGSLRIASSPGGGTEVSAALPL